MSPFDLNSPPQSEKAFPYIPRSVYGNEAFNKHLNTKIQGSLFEHIQTNLGFFRIGSIQDLVRNLLSDFFEGKLTYTTTKDADTAGNLMFPQVSVSGNQPETTGFLEMETAGNLNEIGFLEGQLLKLYSVSNTPRRFIDLEEYLQLKGEYEAVFEQVNGSPDMVIMSMEELLHLQLTDDKIENIIDIVNRCENAFDLIKQEYGTSDN